MSFSCARARHFAFLEILALSTCLQIAGCGGGSDQPEPMSQRSALQVVQSLPGVTPFIQFVELNGAGIENATSFAFTIAPKLGSVSKPVSVRYTREHLAGRGYSTSATSKVTVPVFGLYAGLGNQVSIDVGFADGSSATLPLMIQAAAFADPNALFDRPTIRVTRASGASLGFDFFYIKSGVSTPVVMDTDGQIRWIAAGAANSQSSIFSSNSFLIGNRQSKELVQLELDGTVTVRNVMSSNYTNFHHNIDPGKGGLLAEFDARVNGQQIVESIVADIAPSGTVLREWNLETILSQYMASHGDDPSLFVRTGIDWFHNNAVVYDRRDDSLIVSSRENFLVKLDYQSGDLIWIFGDPTKYWYSFPSLRAKSITLQGNGLYPIGQHAVSITPDGLLLLFNDGAPSVNNPAGSPAGQAGTFSAVSAYSIDPLSFTAQEIWRFDYGQSILSDICSSAYQSADLSTLISYSVASGRTRARLVGLDPQKNVVFDFDFPTAGCGTSWNAQPIGFDNLTLN